MAMPRDSGEILLKRLGPQRLRRVPMYACLVLGGVFVSFDPSNIITDQVSQLVSFLWAIAMAASAVVCLYGAVTDRWIGEYTGLPLLSAVLAMYSAATLLSARDDKSIFLLAFGLVLLSYALGLFARWMDVREVMLNAGSSKTESEEGVHGDQ